MRELFELPPDVWDGLSRNGGEQVLDIALHLSDTALNNISQLTKRRLGSRASSERAECVSKREISVWECPKPGPSPGRTLGALQHSTGRVLGGIRGLESEGFRKPQGHKCFCGGCEAGTSGPSLRLGLLTAPRRVARQPTRKPAQVPGALSEHIHDGTIQ